MITLFKKILKKCKNGRVKFKEKRSKNQINSENKANKL